MQSSNPELILASASPQRSALLREMGVAFTVQRSPLREPDPPPTARPRAWGEAMAYFKARAVAEQHAGQWVLGADTVVWCDGCHLGKARDVADARRMLTIQGRSPADVTTGVCLVRVGDACERTIRTALTRVALRDESAERERYLATGDWADKAGAYGIQSLDDRLVDRVDGSLTNVVGLPTELLGGLLADAGFPVGTASQSATERQIQGPACQSAPGGK
jgi:septum formation protein